MEDVKGILQWNIFICAPVWNSLDIKYLMKS